MGRNLKNVQKSTEPLDAPLNGFFGFHSNFQCCTSQSGFANTTFPGTHSVAPWNILLNIYPQKKQSHEAKQKRKEKKNQGRKEKRKKSAL